MPGDMLRNYGRDLDRFEIRSWPERLPTRTRRALAAVEHRTTVRLANVQAEGLVQEEKIREIDHLSREAMTGQTLLSAWRSQLAGGDPVLAGDLGYFLEFARLAKGEILADTLESFCRESRR